MKKLDQRIKGMIDKCVSNFERGIFLIVGEKSRERVVELSFLLKQSRASHRAFLDNLGNSSLIPQNKEAKSVRPFSILWMYKKDLGFKTIFSAGSNNRNEERSSFDDFVKVNNIRYCYFKESHQILGNTFDILVMQDFESITPNTLCRAIETVSGAGLIIFLMSKVQSLKDMINMKMDFHGNFESEKQNKEIEIVPRFNKRFFLSLSRCENCIAISDNFTVLPLNEKTSEEKDDEEMEDEDDEKKKKIKEEKDGKLRELQQKVKNIPKINQLIGMCKTYDQGSALVSIMDLMNSDEDSISSKFKNLKIALLAGRGRGKSALLGMIIGFLMLFKDFSNIFLFSPSPENVKTVFMFIIRTFEEFGMKDTENYRIIQETFDIMSNTAHRDENEKDDSLSFEKKEKKMNNDNKTNKNSSKFVTKIILMKNKSQRNFQTCQYMEPKDESINLKMIGLGQLIVIDEAAAIPIPQVKKLIDMEDMPVIVSSTISGYEGTGRSLSLKLLNNLKEIAKKQNNDFSLNNKVIPTKEKKEEKKDQKKENEKAKMFDEMILKNMNNNNINSSNINFKEINLDEAIRYSNNDGVEKWLNEVLCLKVNVEKENEVKKAIDPSKCNLYHVNRDTLFSYHKESEKFLKKIESVLVESHYMNQPNDLMTLCDSPNHRIFVLMNDLTLNNENLDEKKINELPGVYCVIQVAFEGKINRELGQKFMESGMTLSGDMIPWTISNFFSSPSFIEYSGLRIVRIATHPSLMRMGYASRALKLLFEFFDESNNDKMIKNEEIEEENNENNYSNEESLEPLLEELKSCKKSYFYGKIDWTGVNFGISENLIHLWRKMGFKAVYMRMNANERTGEHSCIMLREMTKMKENDFSKLLDHFWKDFMRRFMNMLSFKEFKVIGVNLALDIIGFKERIERDKKNFEIPEEVSFEFLDLTENDIKRLRMFVNHQMDFRHVIDLVPTLSRFIFLNNSLSNALSLTIIDAAILISVGLMHHSFSFLAQHLNIPIVSVTAYFSNIVKRFLMFYEKKKKQNSDKQVIGKKRKNETVLKEDPLPKKENKIEEINSNPSKKRKDF